MFDSCWGLGNALKGEPTVDSESWGQGAKSSLSHYRASVHLE